MVKVPCQPNNPNREKLWEPSLQNLEWEIALGKVPLNNIDFSPSLLQLLTSQSKTQSKVLAPIQISELYSLAD